MIPTPRRSVKQMVQDYEQNIIAPLIQFRDGYKPVPTTTKNYLKNRFHYQEQKNKCWKHQ